MSGHAVGSPARVKGGFVLTGRKWLPTMQRHHSYSTLRLQSLAAQGAAVSTPKNTELREVVQ
jgi:hypothetical protein